MISPVAIIMHRCVCARRSHCTQTRRLLQISDLCARAASFIFLSSVSVSVSIGVAVAVCLCLGASIWRTESTSERIKMQICPSSARRLGFSETSAEPRRKPAGAEGQAAGEGEGEAKGLEGAPNVIARVGSALYLRRSARAPIITWLDWLKSARVAQASPASVGVCSLA